MLPDRTEVACTTIDISPIGVRLLADFVPFRGQRVIIYIDRIGRVEGIAVRVQPGSFAVRFDVPEVRRAKIACALKMILGDATPSSWEPAVLAQEATTPMNEPESEEPSSVAIPQKLPEISNRDAVRKYLDFI